MRIAELEQIGTLELLIELMYDGQSGLVDELKALEPISVTDLIDTLATRTGQDVGPEFESWYRWYLSDSSPAKPAEKDILENLLDFKQKTDALVRRIVEQRGEPPD